MTNLVALDSLPVGHDVTETLDGVKAMAEEGQVSAVAVAIVLKDGRTETRWSYLPLTALMVGAVAQLQYDLQKGQ